MTLKSGMNPFGGKNPNGSYVPLSEDELDVIERLAESGEYELRIVGWGHVRGFTIGHYPGPQEYDGNPIITIGDKRIAFTFRMSLNAPETPQPNWYFDIEVVAYGKVLFSRRMPTEANGKPITVGAGLDLDLKLDLALNSVDRDFLKEVSPSIRGITSRRGNMKLPSHLRRVLHSMHEGEKALRKSRRRCGP